MEGGSKRWEKGVFKTGDLTALMGTRRGAFLRGNHLHNGKVVGFVGTVGEVEELISARLRRARSMPVICSFAYSHLPVSSAKQFTNNPSDVQSQYVLVNLLLKKLRQNHSIFIPLMKLPQSFPVNSA